MELTKQDTQRAKGIAIIGMVMLHLFCRQGDLPYSPWLWIGNTPLVYYLRLFGDICVPIYCFCSGYAHLLMKEKYKNCYTKQILSKLFRFLLNYWIIVIIFSLLGLLTGNTAEIPNSFISFLGNVFLFQINYNGAWWFVVTYIILSLLSPLIFRLIYKINPILIIVFSGVIYFLSYLFRFKFIISIENPILDWIWQQIILLGTSQIGYIIGVVCRKESCISKCREFFKTTSIFLKLTVAVSPFVTFFIHCIIQSLIIAPITAISVLLFLFIISMPKWLNAILLFMGEHSTNIWFIHMFFYLTLFDGFVFIAKYPIFVFLLMMSVCLVSSYLINKIYMIVSKKIFKL